MCGRCVPSSSRSRNPPSVPREHGCSRRVGSMDISRSLKPGMPVLGTSSSDPSVRSQAMTGARRQKLGPRTARSRATRSSSGSKRTPGARGSLRTVDICQGLGARYRRMRWISGRSRGASAPRRRFPAMDPPRAGASPARVRGEESQSMRRANVRCCSRAARGRSPMRWAWSLPVYSIMHLAKSCFRRAPMDAPADGGQGRKCTSAGVTQELCSSRDIG